MELTKSRMGWAVQSVRGEWRASVTPGMGVGSDLESHLCVSVDLLHAPPDTPLYQLGTLISRVETLSHVLCYARLDPTRNPFQPGLLTQVDLG